MRQRKYSVCVCQFIPILLWLQCFLSVLSPSLKVCDSVLLLNIVQSFLLASSSCQMPGLRCKLSSCKITGCFIAVMELFCLWNFVRTYNMCKTSSNFKTCQCFNLPLFHLYLINVFNSAKLVIGRPDSLRVVACGFFVLISNNW